ARPPLGPRADEQSNHHSQQQSRPKGDSHRAGRVLLNHLFSAGIAFPHAVRDVLVGPSDGIAGVPGVAADLLTRGGEGRAAFFGQPFKELGDLLAAFAGLALDSADELFDVDVELFQVVLRELAPAFADLAAQFVPASFENLLIDHADAPSN